MDLFDAFLPIGRTNGAWPGSPCSEPEALALMDRYGIAEALVYHTLARDCDPELGNAALAELTSPRLHKVWAFDPAAAIPEAPAQFLDRALADRVRAVLVNPLARGIRIDRSARIRELASLLEGRRIPLLAAYRQWDGGGDAVDWYQLADFCTAFPELPVLCWEWRTRSNRPLFDALAQAPNLRVALSSLWQAQMLACVCEAFGPERLVFSLGLPTLDPGSFIGVVSYADIDDDAKAAVAGGNVRAILQGADYG